MFGLDYSPHTIKHKPSLALLGEFGPSKLGGITIVDMPDTPVLD